jgi:L-arabinose isomerase
MFDGVSLKKKTGVEIEFFEMLEMVQNMDDIDMTEFDLTKNKILSEWKFIKEADPTVIDKGIRIYLALKKIILDRSYEAVSLIDVDGMKKLLNYPPSMVFMLLANEIGICTIPENDTLGMVTQLMCRFSTGQAAAYMEFYDFYDDRVLIGVPDYIPAEITESDITVQPTGFGNLSQGLLNVSKPKTGRMTICRLGSADGNYEMHIVTGQAVTAGKWEEAGWEPPAPMLPSLEFIPDTGVDDLAAKVMSQHCIITYGDNRQVLENICFILGITVI